MGSKIKTMGFASAATLIGLGAASFWLLPAASSVSTDDAYLRADITALSARVGGTVTAVHVSANQPVAAGALLLTLDAGDYQLRVDTAKANVVQAESALAANARQSELAHGDKQLLDSERKGLKAKLDAMTAQERLAEIDLESTRIVAPRDGMIGDLVAQVGARVAPGQRLLSLVALDHVWVEANFKETQLQKLVVGQPATIRLDAMPDHRYSGKVESFAPAAGSEFALLPAENASGNFTRIVQRVGVRIALNDDAASLLTLKPGLSARVRIDETAAP